MRWTACTLEQWHEDVAAGEDVGLELCFRRMLSGKVRDKDSRNELPSFYISDIYTTAALMIKANSQGVIFSNTTYK